jgi:hypothetical protein
MSGLILPSHLQTPAGVAKRERVRTWATVGPARADVTVDAVKLPQGPRFEVQASWETRDHEGPVIRRDLVWVRSLELALELAERAVADLRAGGAMFSSLSELARRARIPTDH